MRIWREDEVLWGETLCEIDPAHGPAVGLADDQPVCWDCTERWFEWNCAVSLAPELVGRLAPWTEHSPEAPAVPRRQAA